MSEPYRSSHWSIKEDKNITIKKQSINKMKNKSESTNKTKKTAGQSLRIKKVCVLEEYSSLTEKNILNIYFLLNFF